MRRRGPLSQPASRLGRGYTLVRVPRTWPLLLALLTALVFPAGAFASLSSSLKKQIRAAGHYSGAMVVDADSGKTLFSWRATTPRILASNTKLFTTSAALTRFGPDGTFTTQLLTDTPPNADGVIKGDLWLRGSGDPAFG